jgi:hypothetical protein
VAPSNRCTTVRPRTVVLLRQEIAAGEIPIGELQFAPHTACVPGQQPVQCLGGCGPDRRRRRRGRCRPRSTRATSGCERGTGQCAGQDFSTRRSGPALEHLRITSLVSESSVQRCWARGSLPSRGRAVPVQSGKGCIVKFCYFTKIRAGRRMDSRIAESTRMRW